MTLDSHFDRFKPFGPPKTTWKGEQFLGNGTLYDLGAHLIDQALVLFGLPTRIFASVRDERNASKNPDSLPGDDGFVDDAFTVQLYYDNPIPGIPTPRRGLLVNLHSSMTSLCERQVRFVARGHDAGWVKHGQDPQEDQTRAGMDVADARFGVEAEAEWGVLTTAAGQQSPTAAARGAYAAFFANLAAAVEIGRASCRERV